MKAGRVSRSPPSSVFLRHNVETTRASDAELVRQQPVKLSLFESKGVRVPPDASTEGWARAGRAVPKTVGAKASVGSTPAPSAKFISEAAHKRQCSGVLSRRARERPCAFESHRLRHSILNP